VIVDVLLDDGVGDTLKAQLRNEPVEDSTRITRFDRSEHTVIAQVIARIVEDERWAGEGADRADQVDCVVTVGSSKCCVQTHELFDSMLLRSCRVK
jgi:hypothetical protein